ncbi:MAG: restriction endonuclease subunit S [Pseudomonadota bacterium]
MVFETSCLDNFLEITSSKRIHMADYVPNGIPFYRSKEVIERSKGNKISTELFISEEQFHRIKLKFGNPQDGDILLTSVGTLGVPYYITNDGDFYFKDGNLTWFRNFSPKLNPKFLYYWLISPSTQQRLDEISIGSTQRALTIASLKALDIKLPELAQQKQIADILSSLDDKIALNREMNKTLEAMAQAIFKSWFVNFEPFKEGEFVESELGMIPKGWEVSNIGAETTSVGGATPSTTNPEFWEDGKFYWATPKDLSGLQEKVLIGTERKITNSGVNKISSGQLPVGTVLLSSRAPIGYLAITTIPVSINQGFIAMVCNKRLPNTYVLQWVTYKLDDIKQRGSGTTFAEISKSTFRPIQVLVPDKESLQKYDEVVRSYYNQIAINIRETLTLSTLCDTLLPKLLSGEIKI